MMTGSKGLLPVRLGSRRLPPSAAELTVADPLKSNWDRDRYTEAHALR